MFEIVDAVEEADGEREDRVKDLAVVEGRRKGSVKRVRAVRRVGERGGMAEEFLEIESVAVGFERVLRGGSSRMRCTF